MNNAMVLEKYLRTGLLMAIYKVFIFTKELKAMQRIYLIQNYNGGQIRGSPRSWHCGNTGA
jgi:hypothetical protein